MGHKASNSTYAFKGLRYGYRAFRKTDELSGCSHSFKPKYFVAKPAMKVPIKLRRQRVLPGTPQIDLRNEFRYSRNYILPSIVLGHRRRLCIQLLSSGHSLQAITDQYQKLCAIIRLPLIGSYLSSTGRDRVLLRILESYLSVTNLRTWWTDINASCKLLILCIDNLEKSYRYKRLRLQAARSRAERILTIITSLNQKRMGYGLDPVLIGAPRIKYLVKFLSPDSAFSFYKFLDFSKTRIPEGILLSILHVITNAGMFAQAIQIFQRIALKSFTDHGSSTTRVWEFRRLFHKLYRAGIPIHQTDILEFLSSIGRIDPLIYNLIIYAAAMANDTSIVLRLTRDYEIRTGFQIPLDAISAVFLMYRRLGDTERLRGAYVGAEGQNLQPLRNSFFITAIMLFETHKPNTSYWDLCKLYRRFFKTSSLSLLLLPLPRTFETLSSEDSDLEPTIGTLTIMLNSYLKTIAGRVEGSKNALMIYERYIYLIRNNVNCLQFRVANEHLLATIVSAVGKYKSNLGLALGIIQDMIDFDYLPSPTSLTWDRLLRASIWHRDVNISERIWEAMLEHGIPPTSYTYSTMIVLYATVGDCEKAVTLRERLIDEGWPMAPHVEEAFDLVDRTRKTGITHSTHSITHRY
ncbi:hypothetical protein TWF694_001585 [Orbilia ellipsospora]